MVFSDTRRTSKIRGKPKGLEAILREGRLWPISGYRSDGMKFLLQCPTSHGLRRSTTPPNNAAPGGTERSCVICVNRTLVETLLRYRLSRMLLFWVSRETTGGKHDTSELFRFMSGMYTIAKQMREAIHEQTAWLAGLERQQLHRRQLGFDVYDDYLASIDPLGQVKEMVTLHENTLRRKRAAESQIQRTWDGVPELRKFVVCRMGKISGGALRPLQKPLLEPLIWRNNV